CAVVVLVGLGWRAAGKACRRAGGFWVDATTSFRRGNGPWNSPQKMQHKGLLSALWQEKKGVGWKAGRSPGGFGERPGPVWSTAVVFTRPAASKFTSHYRQPRH